jgi:DNA-binding CsgD family transcriptional regulator
LRHFERAAEFATKAGRLLALLPLLAGYVLTLYNAGRVRDARTAAEYAVCLARQSGGSEQLFCAHSMLAWMDTVAGRPDRAEESSLAAGGHLCGAAGGPGAVALRMLGEARLMTGDHEGCLDLASLAGGAGLSRTDPCSRVAWYELLTRAELALGRPDKAAAWAESAMLAATRLGQPGRHALALLARAQVLLAVDPGAALPCAEQATAGLAAAGRRIDELRARVVLGTALWHHGDDERAVRELKDAHLVLQQTGAAALARLARTELRRLAARTSPSGPAGGKGTAALLTGREQQIADLVSEGLTNRLIARRLSISEKTVEMHLSKVFAKLGVANRASVAAAVTRDRPEADSA